MHIVARGEVGPTSTEGLAWPPLPTQQGRWLQPKGESSIGGGGGYWRGPRQYRRAEEPAPPPCPRQRQGPSELRRVDAAGGGQAAAHVESPAKKMAHNAVGGLPITTTPNNRLRPGAGAVAEKANVLLRLGGGGCYPRPEKKSATWPV